MEAAGAEGGHTRKDLALKRNVLIGREIPPGSVNLARTTLGRKGQKWIKQKLDPKKLNLDQTTLVLG